MSAFIYIIFISVAILAFVVGAVGAYFYAKARHREAMGQLEALEQDMAEREEQLHRLQYQVTKGSAGGPSNQHAQAHLAVQKLQSELEQKKNDYNILKQDFDLEIGVLKQELEQLREEESKVEHLRRQITRKDAELTERETDLQQKERRVAERAELLDAEIAARKKELEDDLAARVKRTSDLLSERDLQLRARETALNEEREALDRQLKKEREELDRQLKEEREELDRQLKSHRKKQEQLDDDLFMLPVDKFTSAKEAVLIKRLRQQVKVQRDELEILQRRQHQSKAEPKAEGRLEKEDRPNPTNHNEPVETGGRPGEKLRVTEDGEFEYGSLRQNDGDGFAAFSLPSLDMFGGGESTDERKAFGGEAFGAELPQTADAPRRYDDLTLIPGLDTEIQRSLHQFGITTFDQIARWTQTDVRRVAAKLSVDQKTIQDHWIINAQAHLFSRNAD